MIRVEKLKKRVFAHTILNNVSFEMPAKSILGIIGPSGSGKTTLLRCLNGLERIDSGTITCGDALLDGSMTDPVYHQHTKAMRRYIGMVFQQLLLFPHLTILENIIEAPIHVLKTARDEAIQRAEELLAMVGLERARDRYPHLLSGGEQQRVAIIRALAMRPDILLLDEPTSALDPKRSADVRELLRSFVAQGHTLIIVSHSLSFQRELADYVLVMERGEVVEFDRTETIFHSSQNLRTQEFLKHA